MELFVTRLDRLDIALTRWMAHHSITLLRVGLGLALLLGLISRGRDPALRLPDDTTRPN